MVEIIVKDFLGFVWTLLVPAVYKKNRRGLTEMWVYVGLGPASLKYYQEIPLPVFTDWWEGCDECGGPRQHSGNPPGCGE